MSEYRQLHRSFWESGTVEQMDPIEKLIYLYLITGPSSNMEGLYKISLNRTALETGIDRETIIQICARLEEKRVAGIRDRWACVVEATRHMPKSPQMLAHAQTLYLSVPSKIHSWVSSLGYEYATEYDVAEEDNTCRCVGDAKRSRILERDGHRCAKCGATEKLVIHHVVRLADGGTNEDGNLITLCQPCHIDIHRDDWKHPDSYVQYGIALDKTKQYNTTQDETHNDTVSDAFKQIRNVVGLE